MPLIQSFPPIDGQTIQAEALPTADASQLNKIYQYVGTTTLQYVSGYFYKCIFNDPNYEWVNVLVQPGGGGEGSGLLLTGVLYAANWDNNSQTVAISNLITEMNGVVGMLDTATSAQLSAAASAEISVTAINNGSVTFSCSTEPSIDIPFGVLIPGGSTGGDAALEVNVTSNTTVGAIPSGTTLPQGTTFTEFVQKLLISEVAPTISFSISKSGNVAKGSSYTETLTVSVSNMGSAKKIKTIAWYEGNTLKQTDTIDSTATGSWTYTMDTATTATTTFKAIVTYTKSDDTDTSTTKTASISFYYNKFYGAVSSLTPDEATVEALTSALATAKGGTYSFTATAQRICYAYPKSLGALTSIKDGNGFSLFDSFTRTEQSYTQAGEIVAYYRYVLTDATTVSGYSVIFA